MNSIFIKVKRWLDVTNEKYAMSALDDIAKSLSSPRAKRAGPKSLRAESARAVTGRRNSHSGVGEDFLTGQLNFFTKTAVTPEWKVKISIPRWEINCHAEGYKWVIDQNWGCMAKMGFFGQKSRFWAQKKGPLLYSNHVLATLRKSCSKIKSAFAQIIKGGNIILGDFLG